MTLSGPHRSRRSAHGSSAPEARCSVALTGFDVHRPWMSTPPTAGLARRQSAFCSMLRFPPGQDRHRPRASDAPLIPANLRSRPRSRGQVVPRIDRRLDRDRVREPHAVAGIDAVQRSVGADRRFGGMTTGTGPDRPRDVGRARARWGSTLTDRRDRPLPGPAGAVDGTVSWPDQLPCPRRTSLRA